MPKRIGEILLDYRLITSEQLETALQEQIHTGEFLGEILIRLEYVQEVALLKALAQQFETKFVSLQDMEPDSYAMRIVPKNLVWEYKFLPLELNGNVLTIAVSNPLDMWPMSVVQNKLKLGDVHIVLASKNDILAAIDRYYGTETT